MKDKQINDKSDNYLLAEIIAVSKKHNYTVTSLVVNGKND